MAKMRIYTILSSLFCLFMNLVSTAQDGNGKVEMADEMRSNGKIYVVVAVCLTILTGLLLYLVRLDRKIKKLEKASQSEKAPK